MWVAGHSLDRISEVGIPTLSTSPYTVLELLDCVPKATFRNCILACKGRPEMPLESVEPVDHCLIAATGEAKQLCLSLHLCGLHVHERLWLPALQLWHP